MACKFIDSFDHYATANLPEKWSTVYSQGGMTAMAISSSAARTGANGLLQTGSHLGNTGMSYVQKSAPGTPSTLIVGFSIKPVTWISIADSADTMKGRGQIIGFLDGGLEHCSLRVLRDGQIRAYRGSTVLGTSSKSLTLGRWHYLECKVNIHDSTGTLEVRVDGSSSGWLALTGQNTRGGTTNNYATSYAIGVVNSANANTDGSATPLTVYYDDHYYCDTTGSYNTDFLGDFAITCKLPTGNSAETDFSRGGADSGNNYGQVDDATANGDTDYVYSGTPGDKDRYTYPTIAAESNIPVVSVTMQCRKDDGAARAVRALAKLSTTEVDSGADIALSTSYAMEQGIFERDPDGNAWTASNVNSTEFGVTVAS